MKIEYDKEVDAAYIYLNGAIKKGEAKKTIELKEQIILDFDKKEKLIGVEVLDASKIMHKSVLQEAQHISGEKIVIAQKH